MLISDSIPFMEDTGDSSMHEIFMKNFSMRLILRRKG